jgi:hypothetical protein
VEKTAGKLIIPEADVPEMKFDGVQQQA